MLFGTFHVHDPAPLTPDIFILAERLAAYVTPLTSRRKIDELAASRTCAPPTVVLHLFLLISPNQIWLYKANLPSTVPHSARGSDGAFSRRDSPPSDPSR